MIGAPGFRTTPIMDQQLARFTDADREELNRIKRDIRFDQGNRAPHRLAGWGDQDLLEGAHARDFRTNDLALRGEWRLIYDYTNDGSILLLGIIDYHGGAQRVPLYRLGQSIDLRYYL